MLLPPPDDHVLAPPHDVQVAVLVDLAQVTGDQPSVHPGLRAGLGVAEVLAGPPGDAHAHIAHLTGRDGPSVVVDAEDLGRRDRLPHRTGPLDRLARRHQAVDRPGLGHPVVVGHQGGRHPLLQALEHVGGQGCAPHAAQLDRGEVGGVEAGVLEQEVGHGRHQEHRSGALGLHRVQPRPGVEAGHVEGPEPELHRRVHEGDAGKGVGGAGVHPGAAVPVGRG